MRMGNREKKHPKTEQAALVTPKSDLPDSYGDRRDMGVPSQLFKGVTRI